MALKSGPITAFLASCAAACLLPASLPAAPVAQRAQQRALHPFQDGGRSVVRTLEELVQISDLVVEGTVGDSRPTDYGPFPGITTTYDLSVTRVLKVLATVTGQVHAGGTIPVRRTGGERVNGNQIDAYVADNNPLFKRGDHLLLFLRQREWAPPAPFRGGYFVEALGGPESIVDISSDGRSVTPRGKSQAAQGMALMSAEGLRSEIARLAGAR